MLRWSYALILYLKPSSFKTVLSTYIVTNYLFFFTVALLIKALDYFHYNYNPYYCPSL